MQTLAITATYVAPQLNTRAQVQVTSIYGARLYPIFPQAGFLASAREAVLEYGDSEFNCPITFLGDGMLPDGTTMVSLWKMGE